MGQWMLPAVAVTGGLLVVARVLMKTYMSEVYDVLIIRMTARWYKAVLTRLGCEMPRATISSCGH